MSKRPSIIKQVLDRFKAKERYGQSRHEAKLAARAEAAAAGVTGWSPARTEGIHSFDTRDTYFRQAAKFANWVRATHGIRDIHLARPFVKEYIQYKLQQGCSAWTLHTIRSACAKLYQDSNLAAEIPLPTRRKANITRSRGPKAMDKKFSESRNRDLVDFCRAAGLRRHEVATLKAGNIYQADGRLWVFVAQGKGGRPRTVPVLAAMQERVMEIVRDKLPDDLIFQKIPVRADIHGYRRDYAQALYAQQAGKQYHPRDKDERVMQMVSAALGHNRLDVVTRNYLG